MKKERRSSELKKVKIGDIILLKDTNWFGTTYFMKCRVIGKAKNTHNVFEVIKVNYPPSQSGEQKENLPFYVELDAETSSTVFVAIIDEKE